MAGLPPYMRARDAAAMNRVLQAADGSLTDFTPSHMLVTEIAGRVYDVNRSDPWDLISEGPTARRGASSFGASSSFVHQTLEHTEGGRSYRAISSTAFNFGAGSWSVLFPVRYDTRADGGGVMSICRGPNIDDPDYPTATYHGTNRGWLISLNGDGGFGYFMHGANATADWQNTDTIVDSYDAADGLWHFLEVGYNHVAKTGWMTMTKRVAQGGGVAICAQATTNGPGDLTATDAIFSTGSDYYSTTQSNFTGAFGLPICVFLDTVALNRWSSRLTSLPVLQAEMERYE